VFVAQPQHRANTNVIAFFGASEVEVRHPYWSHVLQGIRSSAKELGLEVVLPHGEIPAVGWKQIAGVLLMGSALEGQARRLPPGMPCVALLKPIDRKFGPSVMADDYRGAKVATQHLISLGHRRIGYLLTGYAEWTHSYDPTSQQRLDGYRDALHEAGLSPAPEWVRHFQVQTDGDFATAACASMQEWLKTGSDQFPCTALLAHNDDSAIGVMRALSIAGIKVPQQVSVVGFDGSEMSQLCSPRLTTVKVPLDEIGCEGTKVLWQLIQSQSVPRDAIMLPTELVVRESTASPELIIDMSASKTV
jgi:DNA-binding LacI/PurR family transcriptional regulator